VAPIAGRLSARFPVRLFLGGGLAVVGVALLLLYGLTVSSTASALIPGFIVGGIGIGLVNAPLAATAVSVVEPQRAGMASGINNTFRQVGIATGIAALGAIFVDRITSNISLITHPPLATGRLFPTTFSDQRDELTRIWAQGIASGSLEPPHVLVTRGMSAYDARFAFIDGLNSILLVAAIVLFVGAVLAFLLVRQKDFVA